MYRETTDCDYFTCIGCGKRVRFNTPHICYVETPNTKDFAYYGPVFDNNESIIQKLDKIIELLEKIISNGNRE